MNPSFRSVRFCYRLNATAGLGLARHRPLCENISLLCDSQLSLPTQNRAFGLASNADRLAKTHPSILIFCENRFWLCPKCRSSCKKPFPCSHFPRKQIFSFASNADRLVKIQGRQDPFHLAQQILLHRVGQHRQIFLPQLKLEQLLKVAVDDVPAWRQRPPAAAAAAPPLRSARTPGSRCSRPRDQKAPPHPPAARPHARQAMRSGI